MQILLNDILNLENIKNTKIRFNQSNGIDDPISIFKDKEKRDKLMHWQFWNYSDKRSFYEGQTAIGFIKVEGDKWLLFDISRVTKDLNKFNAVGYEYEIIKEYDKYFGRVIIEFKNKAQNMVRKAESVINDCKVIQVLEDTFDNDTFPGYENVNLSWQDLKRVMNKGIWKTALENQKGVYLITDTNNGKMYVGSAYGANMLHGRLLQYIKNGDGGNVDLKKLNFDYIKKYFRYSILDIYKSTIEDKVIIKRESWWKNTLLTKEFGYNKN
jgi:hypothetical protein